MMNIRYKNTSVNIIENVYEPSEDSFLLADAVLSEIQESERILEVGCGSGLISSVIKANTKASVIGIDINPHAAKCTKENGIDVIRGDLLSCIKGRFDLIIFNPPYLPTGDGERQKGWLNVALDGGYDGRKVIYRFLEDAGRCLVPGGKILMLVSSLSGIDEIRSQMFYLGYIVEDIRHEKYMYEQLIVLSASKK
ncbi:MAG: methyltransferase domain-containing protein [Candidatus Methanoperedens sp.]|nr:MAG: methyltransferase domain-containing protein [Candidatus Methanoperedens sp.]